MIAGEYPKPEAGQVWADNDWRSAGRPPFRVVRVDGSYAYVAGSRRTRILVSRMRPTASGYRLLQLADGSIYHGSEAL